ncbi:MAG: transposase [Thermodesulfovibrionales bacterium]|nr:transposase [Thermodesulfovibrionales bacterium]
MPRIARAVAVGFPHHITQRGNYRQRVFEGDDDYMQYLEWLQIYRKKYALKIWAYCLMSNHVHFIAVPMENDSLAKTFNTLHMRYSQRINSRQENRGHLWQGRFFSCVLDERHLYSAIRYVENNPVRSRLVKKAEDYQWSSAYAHVMGEKDVVLADNCYIVKRIKDWSAYLREKEDTDTVLVEDIRQSTNTGRPCGDDRFVMKMEKLLGRKLAALPKGRPRKTE